MNDIQFDAILKKMAAADAPQLPSTGQIWFRAEIQRKALLRERIERPLVVMRAIAAVVCVVVVAARALWNLAELRQTLSSWYLFPIAVSVLSVLTSATLAWSAIKPRQQRK